ncbi:MAG: hypothetical protein ACRES5_01645, partial [Pseudomonas sp.]
INGLGKGAQGMRAAGRAANWLGRAVLNDLRSGLGAVARGASWLGRAALNDLRTALNAAGRGAAWLARGGVMLGKALGGQLLTGLRLVGQAVLWIGRALLMNPIGLAITGIAVAAFLISRYWGPIKTFVSGLWAEIKEGFSGGITGIAQTLLNFSPVGLFYRAFAAVMNYFGVELPGKFSEFGGMIVTGLVNGITNMAGTLKESVLGIGSSIQGWFTEKLGIQSPSRVFMGYGANISEGAAIGISVQAGLVRTAALGMAAQSGVDLAPPNPANLGQSAVMGISAQASLVRKAALGMAAQSGVDLAPPNPANLSRSAASDFSAQTDLVRKPALGGAAQPDVDLAPPNPINVSRASIMGNGGGTAPGAAPAAGGQPIFQFSPQITVPGGPGVRDQVDKALQVSYPEFLRMIERYLHDKRRLSYGSSDGGLA